MKKHINKLKKNNPIRFEKLEIGGTTPADEDCAQVGDEGYALSARREGRAFINQIHREFGEKIEAVGEDIIIKISSQGHDFGTYYEVIALYNPENEKAVELAFDIENNVSTEWDEEARKELGLDSITTSGRKKITQDQIDVIERTSGFALFDEEKNFISSDSSGFENPDLAFFSLDIWNYGDYHNSGLIGKANQESMEEFLNDEEIEYEYLTEMYSTHLLLLPIEALENPSIVQVIESLDNYPVLDDEKFLELEEELRQESWDSFGRSDFEKELISRSLIKEDAELSDEELDSMAYEASQYTSEGFGHYEGTNDFYFDIEGLVQAVKENKIKPTVGKN
jgi:hypothetical protein